MKKKYNYYSCWGRYAQEEEENRFLSCEEEDLLKICECIDLNNRKKQHVTGSVPIHYDKKTKKLYMLSGDGHCVTEAVTGAKKSRVVAIGSIVAIGINGDSFICVDPKGEISSNKKILNFMKQHDYRVHIVDFRTFDKDGFNIFGHIIRNAKKGNMNKAMDGCSRFGGIISEQKQSKDDFWNDTAVMLITSAMQILLQALSQIEGGLDTYFHLATLRNYITKDREDLIDMCDLILNDIEKEPFYNPVRCYKNILMNPDKTYSCIVSSAEALLRSFGMAESICRMLSEDTFQIEDFYEAPAGLFIVVPDEVSAYDEVTGYLIDIMYQILVDIFTEKYQNKRKAPCNIHFICDEMASIRINDMSSKISASRSRQIYWNLIYQSEKQMEKAYKEDFGTIQTNCKHHIFLGSTDYETLKRIEEKTGGKVTVDQLRGMKKERFYKEGLVMSGNYLYCGRLPDYDVYEFLKPGTTTVWKKPKKRKEIEVYTPTRLYSDYYAGEISFFRKKQKNEDSSNNKYKDMKYIQDEICKKFDELFGPIDSTLGLDSWPGEEDDD